MKISVCHKPYYSGKMEADYLVIGRPIVKSDDPVEAVKKTQGSIPF